MEETILAAAEGSSVSTQLVTCCASSQKVWKGTIYNIAAKCL